MPGSESVEPGTFGNGTQEVLLDLPASTDGQLDELKVVAPADLRAFWSSVTALDKDLRTGKGF